MVDEVASRRYQLQITWEMIGKEESDKKRS